MIPLQQAIDIVLQNTERLPAVDALLLESQGRVLAEEVTSDVDMPPFPRSSMDGYALRSKDIVNVPARLEIVAQIPAGTFPEVKIQSGQAAKIMTGAPVPEGADAVLMVEKTRAIADGAKVEVLASASVGMNIAPQGSEVRSGQVILQKGTFISPAVIGLLAAVGKNVVSVYSAPSVAVLITGDELVDVSTKPQAGQIRNSNGYSLHSQIQQTGARPSLLGVAKDQKDSLRDYIAQGLKHDILLSTGGVSMGDLDLVEDVFGEAGCEIFFNKVAVKPGKPVVFAKSGKTLIFGLPGNPVSAATTFELFVRPAIRKMMGFPVYHNPIVDAHLTEDFRYHSGREYYAPAIASYQENRFIAQPLRSKGSADIVTYAKSNSYLICPLDRDRLSKGEEVKAMLRTEFFHH